MHGEDGASAANTDPSSQTAKRDVQGPPASKQEGEVIQQDDKEQQKKDEQAKQQRKLTSAEQAAEALLEKINNTNKQTLLDGLSYEKFIEYIDDVVSKLKNVEEPYKNTFEEFIKKINAEADRKVYDLEGIPSTIKDSAAFSEYYKKGNHTAIKIYFSEKSMREVIKHMYEIENKIEKEKFNEGKKKEKSNEDQEVVSLLNSVLDQPNFDDTPTTDIKKQINKILTGDETIQQSLKDSDKYIFDKNEYGKDSKIPEFVNKCIKNTILNNKQECQNYVPNMIYDSEHLNYFEKQIKTLSKDKLIRIAFNLDVKRYSTGMFENGINWAQHITFLNMKATEEKDKGILFPYISVKYPKSIIGKLMTSTNIEDMKKKDLNIYNYIQQLKKSYIDFVNVLSFTINEKIREEKSNSSIYRNEKGEPLNSTYNSNVVQYHIPYMSRTVPIFPPIYGAPFFGGKFEFKPNNNQSADILEKMINSLISNLNSHNKYLDPKDMAVIQDAIKKMRNLEKYLAELFVTGSNYAQYIQQEKDYNQKQIKLQEINNINKKINDTSNKMITLKQKLEYIINHMYLLQKKEVEKQSEEERIKRQSLGFIFALPQQQKKEEKKKQLSPPLQEKKDDGSSPLNPDE